MSKRNKHRNRPPRVLPVIDDGGVASSSTQESDHPPYHAEEREFGKAFGNLENSAEISQYINAFAQEHYATLLQMIPTTPGAYLFVWDMT